eukprot:6194932-Pleurochrysis_carterae.AAC.2
MASAHEVHKRRERKNGKCAYAQQSKGALDGIYLNVRRPRVKKRYRWDIGYRYTSDGVEDERLGHPKVRIDGYLSSNNE